MIDWLSAPLSVVLAVSTAAPPGAGCGSDLACTAKAHTEAARTAAPTDKALHLLTAARSRLALFRGTGKLAELCTARRLIVRASGLPHDHLGDRPAATRREIESELRQREITCDKATSPDPAPTVAVTSVADTTREAEGGPPPPVQAPGEAGSSANPIHPSIEPEAGRDDLLIPVTTRTTPVRPPMPGGSATPPSSDALVSHAAPSTAGVRSDQKLLITGGVLLSSAAVAGGLAGLAHARVETMRDQAIGLAADADAQGFTDPQIAAAEQEAEVKAIRWHRTMIGTSVASGVLGAAAIVLVATGIRARRQHRENLALQPTLTGVLFVARF